MSARADSHEQKDASQSRSDRKRAERPPVVTVSGELPAGKAMRMPIPDAGEASKWLADRGLPADCELLPCEINSGRIGSRCELTPMMLVTPSSQAAFDQRLFECMLVEIKHPELLGLVKRHGPASISLFAALLGKAQRSGEKCARRHLPDQSSSH